MQSKRYILQIGKRQENQAMIEMNEYINYLKNSQKSSNTINSYVLDLSQYIRWFEKRNKQKFTSFDRISIVEFRNTLKNERHLKTATINRILSSLSSYNEFLRQKGIPIKTEIFKNVAEKNEEHQKVQRNTNQEDGEVEKFLSMTKQNKRNHALVTTLAYSGISLFEVLNIKLKDINFQDTTCIIRGQADNRSRIIPLHPKIIESIKDYLTVRPNRDSNYLFISNRGNRINRTVVNKIFNKFSSKITPRSLKCFFAEQALNNGVQANELIYILGYSGMPSWMPNEPIKLEQLKLKIESV